MQEIKLIPANESDIEKIAGLASLIWNQHYPEFISREQIDYMLGMMYSRATILDQLQNNKQTYYLIHVNGQAIGFVAVHEERKAEWFINKFYIDQTKAGKGIGALVFEKLRQIINPDKITLTVNRQNYKSINFYFKIGFKIECVKDFDIGNNFVMNDFVMVWKK